MSQTGRKARGQQQVTCYLVRGPYQARHLVPPDTQHTPHKAAQDTRRRERPGSRPCARGSLRAAGVCQVALRQCVCVCVCVCERERASVCVCVCVWVSVCV